MANTKKLYSDYTEVTTSQLTDKIPTLQSGNKVTTLQKIYNLFLTSLNGVFSNKQELSEILIDATNVSELNNTNCVLAITNFPPGTGNRDIRIKLSSDFTATDWVDLNLRYRGFDLNLRSWDIYEDTGDLYLVIYLNVHGNPTEPVLISLKKTN